MATAFKICSRCNQEKSLDEFGKHPTGKLGRRPECKVCRRKYEFERYSRAKFKQSDISLKRQLKYKYDITKEEYEDLKIAQNNTCAICFKNKKLNIDHDHETGKVRGLLCWNCNVAIGHLGDSIEILQSAANYLSRYTERID